MNQEELLEQVNLSGAKALNPESFLKFDTRTLEVNVLLSDIKIEWWANIIYVFIEGNMIICDKVIASGTWPNKYKTNLHLIIGNNTVAVIPTEDR